MLRQALCNISKPLVISNWSYSPETTNSGQNRQFFSNATLTFDGWPWKAIWHLFYATSRFVDYFIAISESKLELQSRNAQFTSKSLIFLSCVTLTFGGWPCKMIGHLFLCYVKFVHHFGAISEFKLELQSGNPQFGWKSAIFCHVSSWNLTDDLEKQ